MCVGVGGVFYVCFHHGSGLKKSVHRMQSKGLLCSKRQGNGFFLESPHSGVVLNLSKAVSFQYISSCFGEPTTVKSFHCYFIAAIFASF